MVKVTTVVIAIILMVVLLLVAFVLLSGTIPAYKTTLTDIGKAIK